MHNIQNFQLGAGFSYDMTFNAATSPTGKAITINGANLTSAYSLTIDGSQSGAAFHLVDGAGNDVLIGGPGSNTFDISRGGSDTVTGGTNVDTILTGAQLDPTDVINGGGGNDVLELTGQGASPLVLQASTITNIAFLVFEPGASYDVVENDGNVAAGVTMTVRGELLTGANALTFDGSAETDGNFIIRGGTGNDVLIGGAGTDTLNLTKGGEDTAQGNGGNDIITTAATFDAGDTIDGGAGSDTLELTGDYSAGVTLTATTMVNVETLQLDAGFNYKLTMNDANVASGQRLTINASALGAANGATIDASAETDGCYTFNGGAGADKITFTVFTANDQIAGGGGNDTLEINGDTNVTFAANTMTGVKNIVLDAGHNYALNLLDANLTVPLTVDASALGAANTLTITNGSSTAAGFTETGGAGSDSFIFGTNLRATDAINGGAGSDIVTISGSNTIAFGAATFTGVETLQLLGTSVADSFTLNDSNMAGISTFTVDASNTATSTITVDASAVTAAALSVLGSGTADIISVTHGGGAVSISAGAGNDTVTLNGTMITADAIDGGTGTNTLKLSGDYSAGYTFTATNVTNFQTLTLAAGHSYTLTTNDATVASGQNLSVDASALAAANALTFDGTAETDGTFGIRGGAGNDTLKLTAFATGDSVSGGAGSDSLELNADTTISFTSANLSGVEKLILDAGHNYTIGMADSSLGGLAGAFTVDASALDATHALTITNGNGTAAGFNETGGAGADMFIFGNNLRATDTINGNGGADIVTLTGGNTIVFNDTTLANIPTIDITGTSTTNTLTLDNADMNGIATFTVDASAATTATVTVDASAITAANIVVNGGAGNDTLTLVQGSGTDTIAAGGGNDTVTFTGLLNSGDSFDGGAGTDTLKLNGDYSGGYTVTTTNMANFETLAFAAGHNYVIAMTDADVASGQALTIDASALASANTLTFDGTAETDGHYLLKGGAGADDFKLTSFASGTTIFAGGGSDTLELSADTNVSLSSSNFTGVEKLLLDAGHNYSFNIADSSLGGLAGAFTVDASALDATHTLNITNGSTAAPGFNETGGAGNDTFSFGNNLRATDTINGGAGSDLISLNSSESITFGATTLQNVEEIAIHYQGGFGFGSGNQAYSASFTLNDGNMTGLSTFTIDGSGITSGEVGGSLTINGSAVTATSLHLIGLHGLGGFGEGLSGTESLSGGGGNDTLDGTNADNGTFAGNGGSDTILLPNWEFDSSEISQNITINFNAVSDSTGANYDKISNVTFKDTQIFDSNTAGDTFHVSGVTGGAVTGINGMASGALSTATFDTDLAAAVGSGQLGAHHAVEFQATSGDLNGQLFLVVDANGTAGYQAGADLVIEVSGSNMSFTTLQTGNFS